ncbi:natural killer cell receptor 2B4-like [Anas platyrhynchos]|uniref:natural killer cell receptor 2B4-like n=1 Tax=Anas platyrhynchos TaxID=8839 RepID=UPI003AF23E70
MLHPRAKLGDAPAQGSIPFLPPPHGARLWVRGQPPAPCITPQPAEDQPPRLPSRPRHASFLFLRGVVQLTMQRAALLLIPFLFLSRAQGCEDMAVPARGELWLLPKEPQQKWVMLEWKVALDSGTLMVIVRVSKDKDPDFRNRFPGRATFLPETLSLSISPVTQADSGKYYADFETASGHTHSQCFHVSVWEPIGQLHLNAQVLREEQGRCNFSLLCSVPGAANVSYSWFRDGEPLGHGNMLQVHEDTEPRTYICNASNPVSWRITSIDTATLCFPPGTGVSWSYCKTKGVLSLLVLGSLVAAVVITHVLTQQQDRSQAVASLPQSTGPPGRDSQAARPL